MAQEYRFRFLPQQGKESRKPQRLSNAFVGTESWEVKVSQGVSTLDFRCHLMTFLAFVLVGAGFYLCSPKNLLTRMLGHSQR